jgi:exopolysaccharide biosynthesis polyprenyl glycosylphosphotransferase
MGQIVNILDATIARPAMLPTYPAPEIQDSGLMRLVPGARDVFPRTHRPLGWFGVEDMTAGATSLCTTLLISVVLQRSHSDAPLLLLLVAGLASFCAIVTGRRVVTTFVRKANGGNVLIVGRGWLARKTVEAIRSNPGSNRSVVKVLSNDQFAEICAAGQFSTFAREGFIDEIVIASREADFSNVVNEARRQQLDVAIAAEVLGLSDVRQAAIENVGGTMLLALHHEPMPLMKLSAKRVLDVLLSASALLVLAPLLILIGFLVRIDSPGPVLYRSLRVGRRGRQFLFYKFRTMVLNAEAVKEGLRGRNERTGAFFKISDDPRITRLGKLLRCYSLDELPQLWNVLLGEMSLVGPRPHPPDDIKHYRTQHLQRLDFVPGITGLWQVTAREDPSFERSVALDVEYIKTWSLRLDLQILWRTVGAVVRGSGT